MAPPPPSQKGKFKPRKPAKKVQPGVTASATNAADGLAAGTSTTAATGPTVVFAPSLDNSSSRSTGRGSNTSREGGRGGRGGRGRGRTPIPSGRVFFTGSERPSSASAKKKSSMVTFLSGDSGMTRNKDLETTEEVVGQLDTAIGMSNDTKRAGDRSPSKTGDSASAMDYFDGNQSEKVAKDSFAFESFLYDSDSSREEERGNGKSAKQHWIVPPLELPFLSQSLPLGVGSTGRPVAYKEVSRPSESKNNDHLPGSLIQDLCEAHVSPFVHPREADKISWEQNSWFLVQLPTRLPPLQPLTADGPIPTFSAEDPTNSTSDTAAPNEPHNELSEVVTPPLTAKSHDNVLTSTAPGRIGKIIVYKSGRTVLKMEDPDGASPILMNVDEGLTCGFLQQAVVIDPDDSKFIALGTITKSIVVTPDLSTALVAE